MARNSFSGLPDSCRISFIVQCDRYWNSSKSTDRAGVSSYFRFLDSSAPSLSCSFSFKRCPNFWTADPNPCCKGMDFRTLISVASTVLTLGFGPCAKQGYWKHLSTIHDSSRQSKRQKSVFENPFPCNKDLDRRSKSLGPHFIAEIIREFLLLVGVKHCLTLAYSKEENAIVERYNKEINRHLHALTFENLSLPGYKKSLPFVQRILNSNHSDRLKISASQMLFGNMLNLDKGIFTPANEKLE